MWVLCDNCVLPSNAKHVVLGDVLVGVEITISQESFILWVPDIFIPVQNMFWRKNQIGFSVVSVHGTWVQST